MGLLNFIKDVGEKLFGASEAKAATVDELKKELDKHGLNADGLQIAVDGDKVTVSGTAANTETAEKIALALGNTVGVAQVDNQLKATQAAPKPRCTRCRRATTSGRSPRRNTARPGRQEHADLRGQQAHADQPGQDLSRPGAAHPASGLNARASIRIAGRRAAPPG